MEVLKSGDPKNQLTNQLRIQRTNLIRSAFRSELGGLYSMIATVYAVCISNNIQEVKVIYWFGGKSALKKLVLEKQ